MLKIILISLAVIVVVLAIVVVMQPADFRVERSATIAAPPAAVFPHVNDLRSWEAWSPWAKLDPAMKQTYEGPPTGVGASYTWVGNNQVGEGRTTIVESRPNELVGIKLAFVRPFACNNDVQFAFKPVGEQTEVTWTMTGKDNFMAKAFGLVMNFDKMVGGQFEQGLASLASAATAAAPK